MSKAIEYQDFVLTNPPNEYICGSILEWRIGKKESNWILFIPKGFKFQSRVPLILRPFLSPHDPDYLLAAAVHAFLIESGFDKMFAAEEWCRAVSAKKAFPKL